MLHAALKIKSRVCLQALSILCLMSPAMSYTDYRETTTITTNISPGDRSFIARCLSKISNVIERTEQNISEFFNERNTERYRVHIDRFGTLLIELERELIEPLNSKTTSHESFKLAHDILLDLKRLLQELYQILERHESSNNPLALGMALDKLAKEFIAGPLRYNIECKVDNLTIIVETIAAEETSSLKQVIIRLCENSPIKGKDKFAIIRCLKHRLGCR